MAHWEHVPKFIRRLSKLTWEMIVCSKGFFLQSNELKSK